MFSDTDVYAFPGFLPVFTDLVLVLHLLVSCIYPASLLPNTCIHAYRRLYWKHIS